MSKYDILREFVREINTYKNPNYKGGDTVTIYTSPFKIVDFINKLKEKKCLDFVKEFELSYSVGNEHRGWGGSRSTLIIDKEFANKIKIRGHFKWIDKGYGDFSANLEYDLSNL